MAKASLSIEIGGNYNGNAISKAEAALKKLQVEAAKSSTGIESSFTSTGEKLIATGTKVSAFGNKVSDVGKKMTVATAPIAAIGTAAAKMSLDFENSIAKVSTIADTAEVPLDQLREGILKLSSDTGIAAGDIADNVYNAISAGQKTGDAVAFVGNAAKLAKAGFTDSASALDVLTTTMNAYKLEADQASHVSDVLLQTQNKGKTTVGELSSSIGKAIPTAAAFNVNLENLAAAYATTTANGVATAESTTYIKSMLKELGDTGSTVGQIIKEKTGQSFSDLMASGASLGDALNILNEEGAKSNKTMYDMFGSAEAASAAAILASDNSAKFSENLSAMGEAAGLTDESFAKMQTRTGSLNKAINKVKNVLIETGDTIVGSLGPALDGFANGAEAFSQWFSNLDEGARQAIANFGLVAVAAGPLLVVGGKIITTVGNTITSVGKASQTIGVFIGKVKGTVPATQEAMRASIADAEAKKQEAVAAEKSATASAKSAAAAKESAVASTSAATADKQQAAAANQASVANSKNASTMQKVGQVAKSAGKLVGGFAASFAFGKALEVVADLAEKHKQLQDATTGLTGSLSYMNTSYQTARNTMSDISAATQTTAMSMGSLRSEVDQMIERNSELAGTLQGIFSEAGTSIGMMENYRDVIAGVGDGTSISAEEASRLQVALDGVNKQCGTSYEVSGNAEQGYRIMADGAEVATDEILKLIDAQKTQIRLEASKEAYGEAYKTLAENEKAAADATAEFNRLLEEQKYWSNEAANGNREAGGQLEAIGLQLVDAKNNMDRANSAYKAQKDTCDALEDSQVAYQMALDAGNGSIADAVANNGLLVSAMQNANKDTTSLIGSLGELGISTSTVSNLTADESVKIAQAYNGTKESVTNALFEMATNSSTLGQQAGQWLTEGFSANAQGAVNAATDVTGLTTAQFKLIADAAGVEGEEAIVALANSISANAGKSTGAARIVKQALVLELTKGDVEAAARILGEDIDQGLVDGITGASDMPAEAVGTMSQSTIDAAKAAFESHSPSQVMLRLGNDIDSGLANGITGNEALAVGAMAGVGNNTINAVSGLPVSAQAVGSSTGSFFATAIGWAKSAAYSNAAGLSSNAKSGISGTPGAFSSTGSAAASDFSSAIGRGDASGSGRTLANTGDRGLRSVKTKGAGTAFSQGFASGISGFNIGGAVSSLANRALGTLKSVLGIHSPSREAMSVGEFFGEGLAIGMANTESKISAMSDRLSSAMTVDSQTASMSIDKAYPGQPTRANALQPAKTETTIVNNYYFGDVLIKAEDLKGLRNIEDLINLIFRSQRAYG